MSNNEEIVKLIIDGENLLSDDVNEAVADLEKLSKESKETANAIKKLRATREAVADFKALSGSINETKASIIKAKGEIRDAKGELEGLGDVAKNEAAQGIDKLELELKGLTSELTKQNTGLGKAKLGLRRYGIKIKEVDQVQRDLVSTISMAEAEQKSLNAQYEKSRGVTEKAVNRLKAERTERLKVIESMDIDERQRKILIDITERQILASRKVSKLVDEEVVSRKKIAGVVASENASRERNIDASKRLVASMEKEDQQRKQVAVSVDKYAKTYDKLIRLYETDKISKQQLIASEKKLLSVLDLKKSQIRELKAEIKEVATEEERLARAQRQTVEQTKKLAQVLPEYKKSLRSIAETFKEGRISAEEYEEHVEALRKEFKLTTAEINSARKAIEKDAQAKVNAANAAEKLANSEREAKAAIKETVAYVEEYSRELKKLTNQKTNGKLSTKEFAFEEEKLRKRLKLTRAEVKLTRLEMDKYDKSAEKSARKTDLLTTATRRLAQVYTVLLAAQKATQAVGASVKGYGELESAITKVEKTTGIARDQVVAMGEQLNYMATNITPTATNELLRFAEVAGQLGASSSEDILRLVGAADALNVSTNLAGDEAVTLLSRILSMTGEGLPAINDLASVVVELGNNFAVAEDEIVHMTREIVTGSQAINLSSTAAAAWGTVLKESGQQAERSRTAIFKLSSALKDASINGGDSLDLLAKISSKTGDALVKDLGENPEKALFDLVKGLSRVEQGGKSVQSTLIKMGITSGEAQQVIGTLTKKTIRLQQAMFLASEAQKDGNKHFKEAAKAYADQESSVGRLINTFTGLKTSVGEAFSDETDALITRFTQGLQETEQYIVKFAENMADYMEGLYELGTVVTGVTDNLSGLGTNLSNVADLVTASVNGITAAVNAMKAGAAEAEIAALKSGEVLGLSAEETAARIKELESVHAHWSEAYQRDLRDIEHAMLSFLGKSNASYSDLKETIIKHKDAIKTLSAEEKARLVELVKEIPFNEALSKQYREQTALLVRKAREQVIALELAEKERKEKKATIKRLEEEKQVRENLAVAVGALNDTNETLNQRAEQLAEAHRNGVISGEAYNDFMEILAIKQKAVSDASKDTREEQANLSKEFLKATEISKVLISSIKKDKSALDALRQSLLKNISSSKDSYDIRLKIHNLEKKIARDKLNLLAQQELETKTVFELVAAQKLHNLEMAKLKAKYDAGIISIGEYNKAKLDAAFKTEFFNAALGTEAEQLAKTKAATDAAADALKRLQKLQQDNTDALQNNTDSIDNNTDALRANEERAGASAALAARWTALNKELHKELDYTSLSVEELGEELNSLNREMQDFELATARATYDVIGILKPIDDMRRKVDQRKRSIIEETQALKQWETTIRSGTLSLHQLSQVARNADGYFTNLSDNQLDPLRAAIEDASAKFKDLSDEINDTFEDTQDRLDNLLGKQGDIVARKFKREMEELNALLTDAQKTGDRKLIDKVNSAIRNLRKAQTIEQKETQNLNTTQPIINDGQPTTSNHTIELKLPNNTTTTVSVASEKDANSLLSALASLGEININGIE